MHAPTSNTMIKTSTARTPLSRFVGRAYSMTRLFESGIHSYSTAQTTGSGPAQGRRNGTFTISTPPELQLHSTHWEKHQTHWRAPFRPTSTPPANPRHALRGACVWRATRLTSIQKNLHP